MRSRVRLRRSCSFLLAASLLLAGCRSSLPEKSSQAAPPKPALTFVADPQCPPASNDRIYRHIEGLDACPTALSASDIQAELNDPFATAVLRQNAFPITVDAVVQAVVAGVPRLAAGQKNYVVGEGSQVPLSVAPREADRSLRYVLTWAETGGNADILLSAKPGGSSSFLQVMSWDAKKNRYNFYECTTDERVWRWAGDTGHARQPRTAGQGCFDCHHNGVVIMKELSVPWNNWHSQRTTIDPNVVPQAVAREQFFRDRVGAEQLESSVRGGTQRYYTAWLRGLFQKQPDGSVVVNGLPELLRHVITNTTVNFASTQVPSADPQASVGGLPSDFFVRDSVLRNSPVELSYAFPDSLRIDRARHAAFLQAHQFRLEQARAPTYAQPGSTFYAFFVPVPAEEDTLVTRMLLNNKVVSAKFVASLLMVDFANPVFSTTRDTLLEYAEQLPTGTLKGNQSDVPARFAALVSDAAKAQPSCVPEQLDACTAEQQFLFFWNLPDESWKSEMQARVGRYLAAVGERIATGQGTDDYLRLAASRQRQFARWPVIQNLNEFSLLLPATSLASEPPLRMKPDGTLDTGALPSRP
ncbi:hypothetical protein [Corallococcus macrosporus]|uniref:Lipoprotein n=1 Tax=Myxococcus fulvus (strain ATCC BAA-855 / HW-1) TaxID=483219 RepID=F8CM34_MYXFH|nr:hypothetical protein [Corallococcus macrosporus]AEI62802.1 hypothetical protein LILAB_04405 [Corallococcus macrosporus]